MANPYFRFKQFSVYHDRCAMKVATDSCLFGAWCASGISMDLAKNNRSAGSTILDIGTGTGLLALMIAQKTNAPIDAVEIDPQAAAQARDNCAASPFHPRIRVFEKDVLELESGSYKAIISNPPFYEKELRSASSLKNVAHHSDRLNWKELFGAIGKLLDTDGNFFLLLPFKRKSELTTYLKAENLFANKIVTVKQSHDHSPFRIMVKGSRRESALEEEELSIWNEQQQYTPEFITLLKDYYLYL